VRRYGLNSRAEIAGHTRLSPSTVAARDDGVVDAGLLTPKENTTGGRAPRLLRVGPAQQIFVGGEVGAQRVHFGAFRVDGSLMDRRTVDHVEESPTDFIHSVVTTVEQLIEANRSAVSKGGLAGIGVSMPSPVDRNTGRLSNPVRLPLWNDVDFSAPVAKHFSVPAVVENDATLMALAEHRFTKAHADDMLFIKLGSGIGCGIMVGGNVYRGVSGGAGDIGHVSV